MTLTIKRAHDIDTGALYPLTPSQQSAYEMALATIPGAPITVLTGDIGSGKSLIIAHLRAQLGGTIYSLDEVIAEVAKAGTRGIVEVLIDFILRAFAHDDLVFLENLTMLDQIGNGMERPLYLQHAMAAVYQELMAAGRKLVIATADRLNADLVSKGAVIEIAGFEADDYLSVIRNQAGGLPADFDSDKVSRTFKKLTGYQLSTGMNLLSAKGDTLLSADTFIETMATLQPRSNLVVDDVEDASLEDLIGVDDVVRELMRTIIIPMTQPELARELSLKPARGVLLHGEPGTGKTTIGRALARQLKGKFFIMDGSVPPNATTSLLEAAEASSPSVFFIDDADVIFKNGENSGFARKLLTKLDGLESESIGNVCIIMTAMDVADMPPAVVRSGRVDVWLHMDLPDAEKRAGIIHHYARSLPQDMRAFNERKLIEVTEGFVPADLRGLVGDARGHIAYDRHKGRSEKSFEDYLLLAAEEIWERKVMLAGLAGKPLAKSRKS